jgi:hypothetical protein
MNSNLGTLDLNAAEANYPKVFALLRNAGWKPDRVVELPPESDAEGFVLHSDAEAFLLSFNDIEIDLLVPVQDLQIHRSLRMGFGAALRRMDPPVASAYIDRVSGTSFVYPVATSGDLVVFLLEGGRALAVDELFHGCVWTRDVFQMMHWILFGERSPGFELRELIERERPPALR